MSKRKPILFVTMGFPGSGKTYFARRVAKEQGIFHLNSDRVRAEIFPKPKYTAKENAAVFRVMDFIAGELLALGVSVIYDANSNRKKYRLRLRQIAKKQGARYLVLWFQTSVGMALKRISRRREIKSELMKKYHRPVDKWVLFRIKKELEEPRREPFVIIDGEQSYLKQKELVLKVTKSRVLLALRER